ncbi:asparagine--tRNA ligase, partial [Candidatus Nomurabacteria bacterium]|nr:asparagine--tRNA ligase [Candidatus Nomurabacteria bacterium]
MTALKITNKDLYSEHRKYYDKDVALFGWIRNIRAQKNLIFIDFNDGTFFRSVQLVAESGVTPGFDEIAKAGNGAA